MKIFWIVPKYIDISLDQNQFIEIIKNMNEQGHDIKIITGWKKSKRDFGNKDIIRFLPSIKIKTLAFLTLHFSLFLYLLYNIFKKKPDFILFYPISFWILFPYCILKRFKVIKTNFILDVRTVPVEYKGLSGIVRNSLFFLSMIGARYILDGMTVITPFMKKVLSNQYRLQKREIGIWSSGVNISLFDPNHFARSARELKKKLQFDDKFVVIYHGIQSYNRGLRETLLSITKLKNDYPDIILLLIGNGFANNFLKNLANKVNLDGNICFIDTIPHEKIPAYIAMADVGILPFPELMWWRVSSPLKLMEYLAMEKPVIVTDIEAHRHVLDGIHCGLFIPSNHPDDIAQGILKMYQNRRQLDTMGKEGRIRVKDKYTWKVQSTKLEHYLFSIGEK